MLKLGYPWLSLKSAQLYPYLSRLMIQTVALRLSPTYPDLYQRLAKRDIPGYPITRILSLDIPKQLFHPDLYWDILG